MMITIICGLIALAGAIVSSVIIKRANNAAVASLNQYKQLCDSSKRVNFYVSETES